MRSASSILAIAFFVFSLAAKGSVSTALQPYVDCGEIPGYVSVLVDGAREEWTVGGWADVASRTPMATNTLFRICSQTKGFCGLAVAKLVVEGKVSLDDPLSRYFPEFGRLSRLSAGKEDAGALVPVKAVVTVRDALSHTAGFPFETAVSKSLGWTSTPPRVAAAIAASEPLAYEPGTNWRYSNTGLDIGVALVETVTGERFEDHLKRILFDPLDMRDTTFRPNAEQQSRLATVYAVTTGRVCRAIEYVRLPRPYDSADRFPSGGAGLFSTPHDLLEFYRMLAFNGMSRDGRHVIPTEAIRDILCVRQTPPCVKIPYSLGLFVVDGAIGHDGALKTAALADPARHQVRLWMMQCDYTMANRWHQFHVWKPAADAFFGVSDEADRMDFWGMTP